MSSLYIEMVIHTGRWGHIVENKTAMAELSYVISFVYLPIKRNEIQQRDSDRYDMAEDEIATLHIRYDVQWTYVMLFPRILKSIISLMNLFLGVVSVLLHCHYGMRRSHLGRQQTSSLNDSLCSNVCFMIDTSAAVVVVTWNNWSIAQESISVD